MKKRLTVTVDADLIASAKQRASERGVSLSSLVEASLREAAADDADGRRNGDAARFTAAEWEARREAWFANLNQHRQPSDDDSDEVAEAWAARWRAWFSGELPPPPRSTHPRYRSLDERMGKSYGIEWTDDGEALDADPPTGPKTPNRDREATPDDGESWLDRWLKDVGPPPRDFHPPMPGDEPRYEYFWYKYRLWEFNEEPVPTAGEQPSGRRDS